MSSEAIQSILSRIEIESLLARYNRSLDRLDEEGLRASFHPDATVYMGGEPEAKRTDVPVRDFIPALLGMLRELTLTHHQIGNTQIVLDGETARAETYFTALHRTGPAGWSPFPQAKPNEDLIVRGRYIDRLERRDGAWRIAHRTAVVDWVRFDPAGDRGVLAAPLEPRSRRDRSDVVYLEGGAK